MIAYNQQCSGYGTVLFGVLIKIWKFFVKFKIKFDFNQRGSALKILVSSANKMKLNIGATHTRSLI